MLLLTVMPIFFLSTGLRTSWSIDGVDLIAVAALLLAASVGGKLIGLRIAGHLLRWRQGEASVIGWLLQTKALIMIIFVIVIVFSKFYRVAHCASVSLAILKDFGLSPVPT